MNNHPLLFAILVLLVLNTLLSIILLAYQFMLGYTGFTIFNYQQNLITHSLGCSSDYFSYKYSNEGITLTICVTIIASIVCLTLGLILIIAIFIILHNENKKQSEQKQQTGIQQVHFSEVQMNYLAKLFFNQSSRRVNTIFLLISLVPISSLIVFKKFLQFYQQSQNDTCPLKIQNSQVLAITVISCQIMLFSILTICFFLIIICKISRRLEMFQRENQSLSFRNQVERIIRQVPESQRQLIKVAELKKDERGSIELERELKQSERKQSKSKEGEGKQGILFGMQRVESVLYQANPSLMLQSSLR